MWDSFLGGLINIAGTLAGRVLIGMGLSVATFTGISTTFDWLKTEAVTQFSLLPVNVVQMLSLLKVGTCISMVCSAIALRWLLSGASTTVFKRLFFS